jgi:1,4-alpha-glucan branching enzyme
MKRLGLILVFFSLAFSSAAQLLTSVPEFIQESSTTIEITADATKGNAALNNYSPTTDVYVHIGCITNLSTNGGDWKYSKFTWGSTTAAAQASYLGNNKWKYTITGGLRTFFGITNASEKILKIAIIFRTGSGSKQLGNSDNSDMYVPVYESGNYVRITDPFRQSNYTPVIEPITKTVGQTIAITAKSNTASDLKLYFNGTQVASQTAATTINNTPTITAAGNQVIIAESVLGNSTVRDTINFFVANTTVVAPLPAGVKQGINYESGDTSVTLVLYAPLKTRVSVIGDFNNWTEDSKYQMNQTPDGNNYWVRITGLTKGTEYAYQYIVDGSLKIADYNTEKILDPSNDPFITAATYPNLKAYPTGKTTGIVSILQTGKTAYNWQVANFKRPDKRNLVIYEMLVRDFVATQNFQTVKDTLSYLKRLGVNAIEVMPFNEFEGNNSWGYNPSFYFAPDKAYGNETVLRQFIDECHKQGIAVIMDMVLNHSFGQSPMVQLYWDAANNRPASNSPWFNPIEKHPFNVGYDFNHESQATKDFTDRVMEHWMTQYKIDGFRWDLSKGFTQVDNLNNVNAWGNYDGTRVAIWKRIYDKLQTISTDAYCILEHFASNTEEIELSNYGMLLWGNANYQFNQSTMGYSSGSDFQNAIFNSSAKGWSKPHLVAYMESHDEERLNYKNINFGNSAGAYNTKDPATALKRNEMAAAFWAMIPGPKMIWQFGELGYDFSINTCSDGVTVDANNCRLSTKPIKWDYYNVTGRRALFEVYKQLLALKKTPNYLTTFTTSNVTYDLAGNTKWLKLVTDSLNVVVVGNFDVVANTVNVAFPNAGTWYSYLTGTSRTATGATETLNLQPGEYYVYTNKDVRNTVSTALFTPSIPAIDLSLRVVPNPVKEQAVVSYNLPETGKVSLQLLSMNGARLGNLFQGVQSKGMHTAPINTVTNSFKQYAPGVYLLQLTINGKQQTTKFIITH